ncbi:RNA ligase family protein [Nocardia rhizosphaerihabitans]|uniref:RNA ligase family protein n=1 Tax=Nocardia rhizosphaerihabitans TaxID=1691570 RepID=UPI003670EE3F
MKFDTPKNENYAAVIAKVPAVLPIPGRDRIEQISIYGHTAVVQKGWKPGDLGVFFPAEVQLSEKYARENNMYRHGNLNADPGVTGYLEDNGRVKALKLGPARSNALFMPLESLESFGVMAGDFKEGDTFDHINGKEVCRKYVVRGSDKLPNNQAPKDRSKDRVDPRLFPQHIDTANFWRNVARVDDRRVIVTQKLHGTSIRIGRVPVLRKLSLVERLAQRLGAKIQQREYDAVYGSRKVIKDANNEGQQHFYSEDIWTQKGREIDAVLPNGWILYGELIGWTPDGAPLQRGYTYEIPKGQSRLYVYRIAVVNDQGVSVDLSYEAVVEFCKNNGLNHAPVVWSGHINLFNVNAWMDGNYAEEGVPGVVPAGAGVIDEGVVIRSEGITPTLLKAKSPLFLEHETKVLDSGAEDIESAESIAA